MRPAIQFQLVSKRYRLGAFGAGSLRAALSETLSRRQEEDANKEVWALKDVSFKIFYGETVGLIGPNGAGKSTTLRLISEITYPTSGQVSVDGWVATLLELGAGFHPELTGTENIYLYGAILGLSRRDISGKFDQIVDFSGLERYLDTPLKRYSSGMYVRLGFAVAAHLNPDILLVDEVLAVGDAEYRAKCLRRMEELNERGTTLIFVSHNPSMIRLVCERSIYLSGGLIQDDGDTESVLQVYERDIRQRYLDRSESDSALVRHSGESVVEIVDVTIRDENGLVKDWFDYKESAQFEISLVAYQTVDSPIIHIRLWRQDGTACFTVRSNQRDTPLDQFELSGSVDVRLVISELQLYGGKYRLEVAILDRSDTLVIASSYSSWFQVAGPSFSITHEDLGVYVPDTSWHIVS